MYEAPRTPQVPSFHKPPADGSDNHDGQPSDDCSVLPDSGSCHTVYHTDPSVFHRNGPKSECIPAKQ